MSSCVSYSGRKSTGGKSSRQACCSHDRMEQFSRKAHDHFSKSQPLNNGLSCVECCWFTAPQLHLITIVKRSQLHLQPVTLSARRRPNTEAVLHPARQKEKQSSSWKLGQWIIGMENGELVLTVLGVNDEQRGTDMQLRRHCSNTCVCFKVTYERLTKPFPVERNCWVVWSLSQLVLPYIEQLTFAKARNFPSDHQKSTPPFFLSFFFF